MMNLLQVAVPVVLGLLCLIPTVDAPTHTGISDGILLRECDGGTAWNEVKTGDCPLTSPTEGIQPSMRCTWASRRAVFCSKKPHRLQRKQRLKICSRSIVILLLLLLLSGDIETNPGPMTTSMLSTLVKSLSLIIIVLDGGLCQEEWKRQLIGSGTEPTTTTTDTAGGGGQSNFVNTGIPIIVGVLGVIAAVAGLIGAIIGSIVCCKDIKLEINGPKDHCNVAPLQQVQFAVTATSTIDDSKLIFKWQKNGSDIEDSQERVSGAHSERLTITDVQKSDEGVYCCVVSTPGNICHAPKNATSKPAELTLYCGPDPEEENKKIRSKYAITLKEKYRSGIPTFLTLQWPPSPTYKVFNLAMISQRELQYGADDELVRLLLKGNVSDAVRKRNEVTLKQISDNLHSRGRKVILIEGAPGAGKSTLAWHLCNMWQEGNLFQEFEIVLFVQLREPSIHSARTLEDLFPAESLSKKKEAISAIQYSCGHQVLIVLDSWDEFPPGLYQDSIISELICNPSKLNMQFSALIITSRPVATGRLQRYTSTRIQIAGFVQSEIKRYFTEAIKDPKMVQKLSEQLKERPIIEASCYLPLNTVIIAHIFLAENHTLPTTLHGVFTSLVLCCIIRHMEKQGRSLKIASLDCLPLDIQEPFNNLCTLAYHGVRENKATFSEEDLQLFNLPTELTTLSLMQGVASFSIFGESRLYNFLHLSTQELLAAIYISKMQPEKQIKVFDELFEQPRFANVFKFYAALTKFQSKGIQDTVSRITKSKNEILLLTLLHCLYEAQDDRLCQFVASQLEEKLMLSQQILSPVDCLSVGHFVRRVCSTASEEFKLTLQMDKFDEYGATLLVRELQPVTITIPNLHLKLVKGYGFITEHGKMIGPYLKVLDLENNGISDEHCAALGKGLKHCTKLEHLNLWRNQIGDDGAKCLSEALENMVNLQVLNLNYNNLGDNGIGALSPGVEKLVHLRELHLYSNSISDVACVALGAALEQCRELQTLKLGGNHISDAGCSSLCGALQECKELRQLSLRRNKLTDKSIGPLTEMIKTAKCLEELYLGAREFTEEGKAQLRQATKERNPDFIKLGVDFLSY